MGSAFDCCVNDVSNKEYQPKEADNNPTVPKYEQIPNPAPEENKMESEIETDDENENESKLLQFGGNETSDDYEPIIDHWIRISDIWQKYFPLDITELIIHYTQFFEFQSNHPRIIISENGLIATHDSSLGDATIMFGRPFPFLSKSKKSKQCRQIIDKFRSKYKLELKILDCGCSDNIGIAFVPKSFNHLKGSPYKYPYTYIIYSDGVYHGWNQKCKYSDNDFSFNKIGTILRIIIDNVNQQIIIINKTEENKKHIIKIHDRYCFVNENGGRQQMRFAFVLYSGGKPENSSIQILSQAWHNQPLSL